MGVEVPGWGEKMRTFLFFPLYKWKNVRTMLYKFAIYKGLEKNLTGRKIGRQNGI